MKISRSRLFVIALEDYIRRHQNRQLLESINRAYQDSADAKSAPSSSTWQCAPDTKEAGLPKQSVVVVTQIFTKSQLGEHIGTLPKSASVKFSNESDCSRRRAKLTRTRP